MIERSSGSENASASSRSLFLSNEESSEASVFSTQERLSDFGPMTEHPAYPDADYFKKICLGPRTKHRRGTDMAQIIVTLRIMPASPEINLGSLGEQIGDIVEAEQGSVMGTEEEPIGFGIKALRVTLSRREDLGSTDAIEAKVAKLTGVESCEAVDARRALG